MHHHDGWGLLRQRRRQQVGGPRRDQRRHGRLSLRQIHRKHRAGARLQSVQSSAVGELAPLHGGLIDRCAQTAIVLLWTAVIPALLAALAIKVLVPPVGTGFAGIVALLGSRFALLFGVALFFLFSGLARYWRYRLPGGRYATAL